MSRKYDRTDLEVFASDVQKLAGKIEASVNGGRKKPHNPKVTRDAFNLKKRLIWNAIEADPTLPAHRLAVAHGVSTKTVLRLMVTYWKRRAVGTEENSNG